MTGGPELQATLRTIASRVCETDGRVQDFYLGAHLALNLLVNHWSVETEEEYMALLDGAIGKEMAKWQVPSS